MTTSQIIITVALGILSNLITALLLTGLKWQLKRILREDLAGVRARFQLWFYDHLELIMVSGIFVDLVLLGFILIKFPVVTVWTVLVIVFCVVVMAFQLSVYIVVRILRAVVDGIFKRMLRIDQTDARRTETVP